MFVFLCLSVTACQSVGSKDINRLTPDLTSTVIGEQNQAHESSRISLVGYRIVPSQRIRFEHLTIEQGLSVTGVVDIVQDQTGFMWFATEDGLNKYDGYSFEVYRHDPEKPNSLTDSIITVVYEDRTGNLWVGTYSGGLVTANVAMWEGHLLFYKPPVIIADVVVSLLVALLIAGAGVLFSLRAESVQQAQQSLMAVMLIPLILMLLQAAFFVLATTASGKARVKAILESLSFEQFSLILAAILALLASSMIVIAIRKFKRSRLILTL